ncbi:hypothetical protein CHGG_07619 [Chaetomium globosum CBS 148.51]|uniref:Uncharacterized protein n=1 Tax=Chaetomium globosum (strain ATCC 6205 / CBS 148.51 / DSM 1962 / NBRC 6347 / NRRL 1970) TaxID=306901 RepID=Q2GWN5_CHAGB|nr:uncharacterized protein CHGG_07619 [Chaetomium globosum CBS 148.51]EAQ86366.1 hypothetical protein CHGG_07619 [Chaetomium globosum CBS 148.51]
MVQTDRGRRPLRGNDSVDDDDWTVYSDAESISSCSTLSYHYFQTPDGGDQPPLFRLKREEQDSVVYEAWNVYYYPARREAHYGRKAFGITSQSFDEIASRTELRRQPSVQSELADMHLHAIEEFRAEHKRCWAARAFRGKGKTYEQHLEEKCRAAPAEVRKTVTDLLFDKGKATSNRYRTRTWTVVAMREQLQDRFAETDFTEVKRHKVRFWKNPKPQEHLLYTVVIRGAGTKVVPEGQDWLTTFSPTSNPWLYCDNDERRRRTREERERRDAARQKRRTLSPSFRAPSPSYRAQSPSYRARSVSRRTRTRSFSPPSYRSWRSRYDSPPPSVRYSRSDSPPPYRSSSPRASPLPSRSPSVRIRVVPRYTPTNFDDTPFPPTPPESFTPPPGVSAYHRPGMFAPPPPPPFPAPYTPGPATTSPFQPRPPMPAYPMITGGLPAPRITDPPTPTHCPNCRSTGTAPCAHYPRTQPCRRPVLWHAGIAYHPPCRRTLPRHTPHQQAPTPASTSTSPPPYPAPPPAGTYPHPHQQQHTTITPFHIPPPPMVPTSPSTRISPPPMPPPMPGSASSSRPASWFPDSPGPMPAAPNPFSPLSTPPLTSAGGSSVGGSSVRASTPVLEERVRTPVVVRVRTPVVVAVERAGEVVRVGEEDGLD